MTSYYFLNTLGCRQSDDKLTKIPCARFELTTHVTLKTVQAGAILGSGLIAPIVSVIKGQRDLNSIQNRAYEYGKKGMLVGLVLGPVMTYAKLRTIDSWDGIYDRSYRLRCNKGQVRADRLSIYGALVGLGAANYLGEELGKGALFGFAGGCVLSGVIGMLF